MPNTSASFRVNGDRSLAKVFVGEGEERTPILPALRRPCFSLFSGWGILPLERLSAKEAPTMSDPIVSADWLDPDATHVATGGPDVSPPRALSAGSRRYRAV